MKSIHPIRCTVLLAFIGAGCGYTTGGGAGLGVDRDSGGGYTQASLYRQDIRTVAVPIFTSKSYYRGVEMQLTQAIVQQIESTTPYKVVPAERADTILEGQVVEIGISTVSNDSRTAIPQEQLYRVSVNFLWKDMRSGRVLVERRNFEQTSAFYPTLAEGRWTGSQVASEQLARGIVQELQADW
jgi:hypothetical protein